MPALVLYKSKYGSTKQYAEWIGEALQAPVRSIDSVQEGELKEAGTVIIGGYVWVGKITAAPFLQKHWNILQGKRVALFSVSGSKPDDPEVQKYVEASLPADIHAAIRFFPLWGRHGKLDLRDRFMMWFPRTALRSKVRSGKTEAEREKARQDLAAITDMSDHVKRSAVEPIVTWAQSL